MQNLLVHFSSIVQEVVVVDVFANIGVTTNALLTVPNINFIIAFTEKKSQRDIIIEKFSNNPRVLIEKEKFSYQDLSFHKGCIMIINTDESNFANTEVIDVHEIMREYENIVWKFILIRKSGIEVIEHNNNRTEDGGTLSLCHEYCLLSSVPDIDQYKLLKLHHMKLETGAHILHKRDILPYREILYYLGSPDTYWDIIVEKIKLIADIELLKQHINNRYDISVQTHEPGVRLVVILWIGSPNFLLIEDKAIELVSNSITILYGKVENFNIIESSMPYIPLMFK